MQSSIPRGPFDQGLFLAHFNKGKEHFDAQRHEDAERELEEAYLLRPRDPRVLNLLGLVYFKQEKLEKAEEVYRKLIAECPETHTLHYNLALVCFKLGRLEDAEHAFLKALEIAQGNPKIHFYLGSIYERLHRYKDAIYQYRQAGAHVMVRRVEGKLAAIPGAEAPPPPPPEASAPRGARPNDTSPRMRFPVEDAPLTPPKEIQPVSPALLATTPVDTSLTRTDRLHPPESTLPPSPRSIVVVPRSFAPPGESPRPEIFRCLESRLLEVDFSGKVYIKQGTIYSYSGNLTFWVKERRPGGQAALVIVTGTGRLLLTDREREITFVQVADEAVFVEPSHLLACEEGLSPRYVRFGEGERALDVVALEGRGHVALSVASRPLPLTVQPALPVSVPAASIMLWSGNLTPVVVDDPQVYEVILPAAVRSGHVLRLEGTGRVLVEQSAL